MGQAKATESTVFQAAERILADGTWPSAEDVRQQIGGGSYRTIQLHLNRWRVHVANAVRKDCPLPPHVVGLLRQLCDEIAGVEETERSGGKT